MFDKVFCKVVDIRTVLLEKGQKQDNELIKGQVFEQFAETTLTITESR